MIITQRMEVIVYRKAQPLYLVHKAIVSLVHHTDFSTNHYCEGLSIYYTYKDILVSIFVLYYHI